MAAHTLAVRFPYDALERIGWTTLEALVGLGAVYFAEWNTWWALPISVGLASLKTVVAKNIGQPGTASTLPQSKDPAAAQFAPGGVVTRTPEV
ncbi:hypothetical protein [Streptomyces longwoodensis]|uniref:hypothetical protein n=1 Tax=Streptomyces longwoodensis TaxID=68231 RepID=UPI0036FFAB8B